MVLGLLLHTAVKKMVKTTKRSTNTNKCKDAHTMPTLRSVITFNVHRVWPKPWLQKNQQENTKTLASHAAVPTE